MGGLGSGRRRGQSAKRTTDDLPALDVRALNREGKIAPGQEHLEGVAPLAWTPCNFGGEQPWFVCPGSFAGCGQRAAILYEAGPERWLCRGCLELAYPSQRERSLRRARRRAEKARSKLGPGSAPRPKGMHHTTFERLHSEFLQATADYVALYNERAAKLSRELSLLSLSGRLTEEHFHLVEQLERERIELDL